MGRGPACLGARRRAHRLGHPGDVEAGPRERERARGRQATPDLRAARSRRATGLVKERRPHAAEQLLTAEVAAQVLREELDDALVLVPRESGRMRADDHVLEL